MNLNVVAAWLTAFACTVIWLSGAFLVAFPEEVVNLEIRKMAMKFMDADHAMERIFIPLLVCIDIIIDWWLGHLRLKGKAAMFALLGGIAYVVVMIVGPAYSQPDPATIWNIFLLGIFCLMIPRFGAYFQTPALRPIGTPAGKHE